MGNVRFEPHFVPTAMHRELKPKAVAAFDRALNADYQLMAKKVVDTFIKLVRPTDELCHACVWELIVKPLVSSRVGHGRGYEPMQAEDPDPTGERFLRVITAAEYMKDRPQRAPAETETEKWMRTSEAYDAFTDVLLKRLEDQQPTRPTVMASVART